MIYSDSKNEDEKVFKKQEPIGILEIIGLINNIEKYQNI